MPIIGLKELEDLIHNLSVAETELRAKSGSVVGEWEENSQGKTPVNTGERVVLNDPFLFIDSETGKAEDKAQFSVDSPEAFQVLRELDQKFCDYLKAK